MEYSVLTKDLNEYTQTGLRGAISLAKSKGRGLKTKDGTILYSPENVTNAPEVVEHNEQGNKRDSDKLNGLLALSRLAVTAPSLNKGSIGANNGWYGYQKPYLTIVNKKPIGTEDLNKYIGLPLEAKLLLSTVTGYTEISEIYFPENISDIGMSIAEENEIKNLLRGGVVF